MRVLALLAGFVFFAVLLFAVFIALIPKGTDTDCSTVRLPTAERFRALDGNGQEDLAGDLEFCSRLKGLTRAQLEAALGPPTASGRAGNGKALVAYEFAQCCTVGGGPLTPDRMDVILDAAGKVEDTTIMR